MTSVGGLRDDSPEDQDSVSVIGCRELLWPHNSPSRFGAQRLLITTDLRRQFLPQHHAPLFSTRLLRATSEQV
jgi:hypothetical protein